MGILLCCIFFSSCKTPSGLQGTNSQVIPQSYTDLKDTTNSAQLQWREFFADPNLVSLIDTAITKNLDLMMTFQEIEVAKNNVRLKSGQMLPTISGVGSAGINKVGQYTSQGAGDASADITPGRLVPSPLNDYKLGLQTSWEADIWGKLRNAKKAAVSRYLGSIEGKNFVVTNLVAEVANTYYELLALDNELEIIRQTIQLQQNGLEIVKVQKEAAAANELAVKQFEAQLYNSQSLEFDMLQRIAENENKINALLGRFPQKIVRDQATFTARMPNAIKIGIPAQLLKNRPDIKQAEMELVATKCDVKAAQAAFYPSLNLTGSLGFQAFKTSYLFTSPQSLIYSIVGDLAVPLVNRSAIKAGFNTANAYQLEALFNYQRSILNGFVEVSNEMSNIRHSEQTFNLKTKEADALAKAVDISIDLFKSARANYLEVLMSQRDALGAKLEFIEAKKQQFNSVTNIYKALGGGWK
ncbi:MAG: efflux transporter outer membrane subunit [Prolixibacteraceae bacterium]